MASEELLLGQYALGRRVGSGRLAQVYRARGPSGDVAVKLLAPDAELDDPAAMARFEREIQILASVRHPNVIELIDSGIDDELGPYLVTPYIDGRTLRELIAAGTVEPSVAALAAREIAAGLGAIHRVGLVHRDLKPENVMVRADGSVAIIDFGLAWGVAQTRYTEEGAIAGSVPYMAPEQIEGSAPCPGTDLWALAVIAHEWIAGERPFARERQSEEVAAILSARFAPLAERDRRVSPEFGQVIDGCLRREAGERPVDGEAFSALIEPHARGDAREALADPFVYSRREARSRADALAARARELIDRGKPFAATKLIDRALCHCPDATDLLELADAVGKTPMRTRRWRPLLFTAALAGAIALAVLLLMRGRGASPEDGDEDEAIAEATIDAGSPLPLPFEGLRLLALDELSNSDPVHSKTLKALIASSFETLLPPEMYPGNPYRIVFDAQMQPETLPEDPDSRMKYARALIATFRHEDGIAELEAVAASHPERPDVWMIRGQIALRRGEFDEADRLLSGAIDRDPKLADALRDRGRLRRLRGRTRDAYEDLVRSAAMNPHDALTLRELTRIYHLAGRPRDAIPLMERAAKLAPKRIDVWILYAQVSEDRDALPLLDRALALKPSSAPALRERCLVMNRLADPATGEACQAARGGGNFGDPDVVLAYAASFERAGNIMRAQIELNAGTGTARNDHRLYVRKAVLEDKLGFGDMAAESRRKACQLGHRPSCEAVLDDKPGTQ